MDIVIIILLVVVLVVIIGGVAVFFARTSNESGGDTVLAELKGQLEQITQTTATLQNSITQNFQNQQKNLTDTLQEQTKSTAKELDNLNQRLAVIDRAQQQLKNLADQTTRLENVLSNKQARGAYGEIQLENLVRQVLPDSSYQFQVTLSNKCRVDCFVELPHPPGPIAIDAKFPLEAWRQLDEATDDESRKIARATLEKDFITHINNIADRYIITGETAESALMFVPSESVYAELHTHLDKALKTSFTRRVYVVSPTTMMATLNTIRAVLRDVQMREQAAFIQQQVGKLLLDVGRLNGRVDKLKTHFGQAQKDIDMIDTSSRAIIRHGEKIEQIDTTGEIASTDGDITGQAPLTDA